MAGDDAFQLVDLPAFFRERTGGSYLEFVAFVTVDPVPKFDDVADIHSATSLVWSLMEWPRTLATSAGMHREIVRAEFARWPTSGSAVVASESPIAVARNDSATMWNMNDGTPLPAATLAAPSAPEEDTEQRAVDAWSVPPFTPSRAPTTSLPPVRNRVPNNNTQTWEHTGATLSTLQGYAFGMPAPPFTPAFVAPNGPAHQELPRLRRQGIWSRCVCQ